MLLQLYNLILTPYSLIYFYLKYTHGIAYV